MNRRQINILDVFLIGYIDQIIRNWGRSWVFRLFGSHCSSIKLHRAFWRIGILYQAAELSLTSVSVDQAIGRPIVSFGCETDVLDRCCNGRLADGNKQFSLVRQKTGTRLGLMPKPVAWRDTLARSTAWDQQRTPRLSASTVTMAVLMIKRQHCQLEPKLPFDDADWRYLRPEVRKG